MMMLLSEGVRAKIKAHIPHGAKSNETGSLKCLPRRSGLSSAQSPQELLKVSASTMVLGAPCTLSWSSQPPWERAF